MKLNIISLTMCECAHTDTHRHTLTHTHALTDESVGRKRPVATTVERRMTAFTSLGGGSLLHSDWSLRTPTHTRVHTDTHTRTHTHTHTHT